MPQAVRSDTERLEIHDGGRFAHCCRELLEGGGERAAGALARLTGPGFQKRSDHPLHIGQVEDTILACVACLADATRITRHKKVHLQPHARNAPRLK